MHEAFSRETLPLPRRLAPTPNLTPSPPTPSTHREETKSQKAQVCLSSMELAVKQKHLRGREGHLTLKVAW